MTVHRFRGMREATGKHSTNVVKHRREVAMASHDWRITDVLGSKPEQEAAMTGNDTKREGKEGERCSLASTAFRLGLGEEKIDGQGDVRVSKGRKSRE